MLDYVSFFLILACLILVTHSTITLHLIAFLLPILACILFVLWLFIIAGLVLFFLRLTAMVFTK
jgi:hypothetical protein